MKSFCSTVLFFGAVLLFLDPATAQERAAPPVTKNASPEAVALLNFFYSTSGKYLLTGQHNYPNVKDRNTQFAADYIGKTPVVFSTDWGFAEDGNSDSYLARPDIVKEAIRQHQMGSIITICWHAVPPTANEPVTFQSRPGADPALLKSVQGRLTEQQFRDILTPGTDLYKHWTEQVDSVAVYLKKLRDAHVPVLWRPYHEMNGDWFWWGGRQGEYSTIRLYKQLFDRLVNVHHLNNLVWLWNVDRPTKPERKFTNFYPGNDFLDILSIDIYGSDFSQAYYDSLLVLSKGKPVLLGEVGNPPTPEVLSRQPRWGYYVVWAGMVRNTTKKQYAALVQDPRVLFLEDTAYWKAIDPFRKACGLPSMYNRKPVPADFSGHWVMNEEKSDPGTLGLSREPAILDVVQSGNAMTLKQTMISEYSDPRVAEQRIVFDGQEYSAKDPFSETPLKIRAGLSAGRDTALIDTRVDGLDFKVDETWTLRDRSRLLYIRKVSRFDMKREAVLVYEKR